MSSKSREKGDPSGAQTFRVLASSKSSSSTILARFVGSKLPVDLTASNASRGHDAWTIREERLEDSGPVVSYTVEKNSLAEDVSERAQYKGAPEGTITGASKPSNYFILVREKGDFVAVPVDKWVTFRYSAVNRKFDAQSLEEAEAAMKYRRLEAEKQDLVSLAKLGDLEKQDRNGKKDAGKGGKTRKEDFGKKEEPDSEDEWKDVKAEKLKKRSMMMAVDDGLGIERQSTALDFKDEYKPKNAEDWEHEIAADDDDLDMGDDEVMEEDLAEGGFENKRRMHSPSVSGDDGAMDGELSDGGMGDTSLRRKIQRTLKKRIGEGSDEDGDGDGVAGEDLSDDDDVDALDAMASGDFMPPAANQIEDDARKTKDNGKKRKIDEPTKSAPTAVTEKKQKLKPREATGVPSEEEIKSLLTAKKRMLLGDLSREFKKRLKSKEEMKTFTSRVKAVAMFDPNETDKTKRYLILKP